MSDAPTVTHACPNAVCPETFEFQIEPYVEGRTSGPPENCYPPEGGAAYHDELEACPVCAAPFTDEFLDRVYAAWEDSQEPDEPDVDDGRDYWED